MKRALLISSAALAVTAIAAPIAALDVDVNGRVRFEVTGGELYITTINAAGTAPVATPTSNNFDMAFSTNSRVDVNVSASTCCLNYGGKVRMNPTSHGSNIYMSGDWGRLDFGDLENARGGAYDVSVVDAGPLYGLTTVSGSTAANDLGFDGSAVSGASIRYTGSAIMGLTPKVAWDGDDLEGSLAYAGDFGGAAVTAAASTDSNGRYGALATAAFGDIKVAAFTGEDDDSDSYTGAGVKYTMGAMALSLSVVEAEGTNATPATASEQNINLGASYTIAPGLTASASYRQADNSVLGDISRYMGRLQLAF